jgi:hypothetical protein
MDLFEFKISLGDLMEEEVNAWESLHRLVAQENWEVIGNRYSERFVKTIKREVESRGKDEFVVVLRQLAKEESEKLNKEISDVLKNATSIQSRGSLGDVLSQVYKRADDHDRRYRLLAAAFADRLTDMVFPAAERAAKLTEMSAKEKPTVEAEKYLEEACLCYFYELYSASAVMCRSILEEIIGTRVRQLRPDLLSEPKVGPYNLGALIAVTSRPASNVIPPEAWREIRTVNELGNRAAHEKPLGEKDALECLLAARHCLVCILK